VKKPAPEKVFCLYHQTVDCICLKVVTTREGVKRRINNQLAIWRILYKFEGEGEKEIIKGKAEKLKERLKNEY